MDNYITQKDLQDVVLRLEEINKKLSAKEKSIKWIDNAEFMQLLHISRRTAQNYRDNNLIAFSIIGNKLFYKLSDIEQMLNDHYQKRLS